MLLLIVGIVVLLVTATVFWMLLPRGEKLHRWANTEFEPYVSVAICAGVALGCTMVLSSVITLMSAS